MLNLYYNWALPKILESSQAPKHPPAKYTLKKLYVDETNKQKNLIINPYIQVLRSA